MVAMPGVYKVLVWRSERKRPLGTSRHRWEDNITMDLKEVGWGGMDLVDLAQERVRWQTVVNVGMNLWVL
jgi:hypothetical protein